MQEEEQALQSLCNQKALEHMETSTLAIEMKQTYDELQEQMGRTRLRHLKRKIEEYDQQIIKKKIIILSYEEKMKVVTQEMEDKYDSLLCICTSSGVCITDDNVMIQRWTLKNSGKNTWPIGIQLRRLKDPIHQIVSSSILYSHPQLVLPNATIDISIRVPKFTTNHEYILLNDSGNNMFGPILKLRL